MNTNKKTNGSHELDTVMLFYKAVAGASKDEIITIKLGKLL